MPRGALQTWVEKELWEGNYFAPERLGETKVIFNAPLSYPLVASIIDARSGRPLWAKNPGEDSTAALFRLLRPMVLQHPASWFYITDPDNALSVFEWEKEINPDYFNAYRLIEFEKNPAVEGGASHLCVGFHDRAGLVVFEYECELKVVLHATEARMRQLCKCLGCDH